MTDAERFDKGIDAVIQMQAAIDDETSWKPEHYEQSRIELRALLADLGATQEQIDSKLAAVDAQKARQEQEDDELRQRHGSLATEETKRLLCMAETNPGGRHTYAALGDQRPRCTHCGYEPDVASYSELLGSNSPKVRRPQ